MSKYILNQSLNVIAPAYFSKVSVIFDHHEINNLSFLEYFGKFRRIKLDDTKRYTVAYMLTDGIPIN